MDPIDVLARLTIDPDNIIGTDGDDIVVSPPSNANFQGEDVLDLKGGTDTLLLERTGFLGLSADRFARTTGLDVIDMTAADELRIVADDALLQQSDAGVVRFVFGAAPLVLDLRDMTAPRAGYVLDGAGPVELLDTDQIVTVADGVAGDVTGGTLADTIQGGDAGDDFSGGRGNDLLEGNGGDDRLSGGDDHDELYGGLGDDTLLGGAGYDLLRGGAGANTLTGGSEADVFVVRPGSTVTITDFDVSDPYERIDLRQFEGLTFRNLEISAQNGGARVAVDAETVLILEGVSPGAVTDRSFAFEGQPSVSLARSLGTPADFTFTSETDTFRGGAGDEIFEVVGAFSNLSPSDVFDGGAGTDTLRISGANRSLSQERIPGMDGIEIIDMSAATGDLGFSVDPVMLARSSDGTLTIRHGASSLLLDANGPEGRIIVEGVGPVLLRSADGQAVTISDLIGGNVTGGNRADLITGGARADRIDGGERDDTISGGGGNDTLSGGEGDDTFLLGGSGDVTVTGGAGFDTYVITPGSGRITITDFDTLNYLERIDISATSVRGPRDVSIDISGGDVTLTAEDFELVLEGAAGARFGVDDFLVAGQRADRFRIEADAPLTALQPLLDQAPDGSVITLAPGRFNLTQQLEIERSNITVKGSGEGQTVIVNRIPDALAAQGDGHFFLVQGREIERELGTLTADAALGTRTFQLERGHGLEVGDLFFVHKPNDAAFLAETGNTGWEPVQPAPGLENTLWLREFRSRVTEVDGNTVTVAERSPYAFDAGRSRVVENNFLTDVHLSDFTVEGRWGEADPFNFTNTLPAWANTNGVEFDGVQNSSMRNITAHDLASSAFRWERSHEVEGRNLTADGAHNKAGSDGLGFLLQETFRTDLQGFTSIAGRHAYEFAAYSAEHYNFAQIDFTDRDINFHGSPDSRNVVRVDEMVMDYPAGSTPQWRAVGPGVFPLHPYPTIEENDVTFAYLEAGERQDTVTADPGGGYLDTGIDNDFLYGGLGNDTLIGGTQGDVMAGGGGRDRFVWTLRDGTDTILDFETGRGGDILELRGTGFTAFDQLTFGRQDGQTVLFLGGFGEIRLGDIRVRDIVPANIALQDAPVRGADRDAKAVDMALVGSSSDDRIGISRFHLEDPSFSIAMGSGFDTVTVRATSLVDPLHTTGRYTGVDAFDLSMLERGDLVVARSLVAQSDANALTLIVGNSGDALNLQAGGLAASQTLFVEGARTVRLSDSASNAISIADIVTSGVPSDGGGAGDRTGGTVVGGRQDDAITGGNANDRISGGAGNDTIGGGAGADRLTGGGGRDQFVFEVPGAAFQGVDLITDFTPGQDRILLDIPDGIFPTGRLPGSVFSATGAAQDRGDRVVYDRATGELSIDINGSDRGQETVIARLNGAPDLTANDIFLI
ncbi:calcium-binding protein [Jannaschia seohaensis]|uniref:Ca2+-binding RTX toxin-like protein n=1 Tax=Jannaschia seohaensis TaxID=475081 RepID=A0A2Y9C8Y6_9RHOB|nr:hypothetical protein [Jannaschia seohaensis]PWJ12915.1 Ca2+-binding RTX toxin-like protein [Jannaschia seohaensis]SSA50723.1 Ca2+-binding protein, RTX toxin-related [Jannaschia seohaensis]